MEPFLYPLLLAHLMGDFALQSDWMVRLKRRGTWGVLPHVTTVGLVTCAVMAPSMREWTPLLAVVIGSHLLIDVSKVKLDCQARHRWQSHALFVLDQALHLSVLVGVATVARRRALPVPWQVSSQAWEAALLLVLAAFVVGILFRVFLPLGSAWPNRWPATVARGTITLAVFGGYGWATPVPLLLGLGYHRVRGQPLNRQVWTEALLGGAIALLLGALYLRGR